MGKTDIMTKVGFKIQQVVANGLEEKELVKLTAALEKYSTHPISKEVTEYAGIDTNGVKTEKIEEVSGYGLKGQVNDKEMLAGNIKLLKKYNIAYLAEIDKLVDKIVAVAIHNRYAGSIIIADEIKNDAVQAVKDMHSMNIKTVMFSRDKQ